MLAGYGVGESSDLHEDRAKPTEQPLTYSQLQLCPEDPAQRPQKVPPISKTPF